jgi:hypothetical protein
VFITAALEHPDEISQNSQVDRGNSCPADGSRPADPLAQRRHRDPNCAEDRTGHSNAVIALSEKSLDLLLDGLSPNAEFVIHPALPRQA